MAFSELSQRLINRPGYIVAVGRAGLDLYPMPDGTKTAEATAFTSDMGGSAGNIAAALAKRDIPAGLLSCVSSDPAGDFVMSKLATFGISSKLVQRSTGLARTSLALAESRTTDCEVVIYRNDAADLQLTKSQFDALDDLPCKALVITGTALSAGDSRRLLLERSASLASSDLPLILDIDFRITAWQDAADAAETYRSILPSLSLLVGNDEEFDVLALGTGMDGLSYARKCAKDGLPVLYKMGAKGCLILDGADEVAVGIYPVDPLKPFGAGDAFLGNLLAEILNEATISDAVQTGAAAAAHVVTQRGCAGAMPDGKTLQHFIETHKYRPAHLD